MKLLLTYVGNIFVSFYCSKLDYIVGNLYKNMENIHDDKVVSSYLRKLSINTKNYAQEI